MSDRVTEALARFRLAADAEHDQREREIADLKFQVPEMQWPDAVTQTRAAQTINNLVLPARPMLSIPKLDQPIQLVLNQERQAHLGVQVHALNAEADDDTAEIIQGVYRRIEVDSRANLARSWAFERAVKCGRGWYRIIKEYDPNGGHASDQRLVVKRILGQGRVYADPFAQEPDWSDGEWLLFVDDVPWATYKRQYKGSKLAEYDDDALTDLGSEQADWVGGDDDTTRTIRVAEYFWVEYGDEPRTWQDADGTDQSRPDKQRRVCWIKMNAIEELEQGEHEGQFIPFIPVIGRELIPFDGQRRWVGIISNNKDAQRLFNYAASGSVEAAALEPKAPFDVDPEEIEGYESWWAQANTRNFPYLPRKKFLHGQVMGPIGRIQADTSKMQVNAMLLQQAGDFIHAGTGAFEPSLGQSSPNAKTKGGTLALQQQHDQGNSNWIDNLAEISLTHEARVILDLIPFVYDRPGRVARILDLEDNPQTVVLNQPYTAGPKGPQPVPEGQVPPDDAKHYDLTKGRYGVTVSIGKAYKSRVEEGADELGLLFQAEPQLFTILGDIYLKFRDFPGHLEAAERVKKMLPPALQDQQDPQAAQQQVGQLQGQVQQLTQQLQQAVEYVKTEQAKYDAQKAIAGIKAETDLALAHVNNAAKIEVARITAAKEAINADAEAHEELLATGIEHAFVEKQTQQAQQHEMGMARVAGEQAAAQGQQDTQGQAALAEQGQAHALEQGQQGHKQALEQGQQAADLAPEPKAAA